MKHLILAFLFLSSLNLRAQNDFEKINCNIEMTTNEILNEGFDEFCTKLKGEIIISFQVKVPKQKTVFVKGNLLNDKASDYISRAKVGDKISIFNIKVKSDATIPPIIVTIKE